MKQTWRDGDPEIMSVAFAVAFSTMTLPFAREGIGSDHPFQTFLMLLPISLPALAVFFIYAFRFSKYLKATTKGGER